MLRNERLLIDSVIKTVRLDPQDRQVIVIGKVNQDSICLDVSGNRKWIPTNQLRKIEDISISDVNFWCQRLDWYYNKLIRDK